MSRGFRLTTLVVVVLSALTFAASPASAQDPRPDKGSAPQRPQFQTDAHYGSSPFDPPTVDDSTFVVDRAGGLDTGCTFRSGGPLVFSIRVGRVVGDVATLKQNGLISATVALRMPAYDIDFDAYVPPYNPERDRVTFNGHVVPGEFLTGANNIWKLNSFNIPIEWVNFPSDPGANGQVTPVDNTIRIDIDVANGPELWCTAIDWAALQIQVARPVVMAHGILSNGGIWNNVWVPQLQALGVLTDNDLNMGNLDSIGNNAAKVGAVVERARRRWGVEKVNIVAHSKGGLDSREYVESRQTVERLQQLGTPNAGSPLADFVQTTAVRLLGPIPTVLVNLLAGPAGVQLTTPYMAYYNATHGSNPNVEYHALAGDYDPDCFILNPFCKPVERFLLFVSGRGDTIVPLWSAHALPYTRNQTFATKGNDKEATHGGLHSSMRVFNLTRGHVAAVGRAPSAAPSPYQHTVSAGGEIGQGELQTQAVAIDQAAPTFVTLFFPSGDLDLVLVSPGGRRIDPAVAASDPLVEFDVLDVLGGRLAVYSLRQPEIGLWSVEVRGLTLPAPVDYAVNAWIETADVTFVGELAQPHLLAGDPLDMFGTLRAAGSPLTGASVEARVLLPDNTWRDVTLADDGLGIDTTAGDGVYSGRLADPAQTGTARIAFAAQGATAGGRPFSREAFGLATLSAIEAGFNAFRDAGVDTDADTFFNTLALDADVSVSGPGSYRVFGVLTDTAGNRHEASSVATLAAGTATVRLTFDGGRIFQNRVDGPYTLASVTLIRESGVDLVPVAAAVNAHVTAAYPYTRFQHAPIRLTGNGSAVGVDLNGNGLFDRLAVGVQVELDRAGFYQWSGQLRDSNGRELGFDARSAYFNAGVASLTFDFNGRAIGENGVDGPYRVTDLLVFGAGANLVSGLPFETPAFLASQFEGFVFDNTPPTISLAVTPRALWPPNHQLVEVRATLTVSDDRDPNPRVTLLSISSNEPDDGLGDGDVPNDIQEAAFGTDDRAFLLRSERSGTGSGRTYTITYKAHDAAGNSATATATVSVPHSMAGGKK